ncbi:pectinesterase family protein [Ferruginibacter yonginensis]|uniref:Pectinesterase n=1 Tax=Ferruginibacter yonginensis TaxID=1310416 RepID=A0ABV8QPY3_9BACT
MKTIVAIILCLSCCVQGFAQKIIVVAKKGKADFSTIQGAINSLTDSSATPRVIYIKNGVYNEKIYIEKHQIILKGESNTQTIITNSIAREEWRCMHNDDWGVATVNIDGNDITLQNLTIINDYGLVNQQNKNIYCSTDTTATKIKTIKPSGHQMALRTMAATRLRAINCVFKAFGGDTVSPWNTNFGMFYFKDCAMYGGVDFYCPRGWAYAENCTFNALVGDAAIWHDGSAVKDSKTVLKNCTFKGYNGFKLGRYHRDAQFYLIDCLFDANMADKDIYLVPTSNTIQWGRRVYYFNCHKKGGDYTWFANNLETAENAVEAKNINVNWVFGTHWNPEINIVK